MATTRPFSRNLPYFSSLALRRHASDDLDVSELLRKGARDRSESPVSMTGVSPRSRNSASTSAFGTQLV